MASDLSGLSLIMSCAAGNDDKITSNLWKMGDFGRVEKFFVIENRKLKLEVLAGSEDLFKDCVLITLEALERSANLKNCPGLFADPARFSQYLNINCSLIYFSISLLKQKQDRSLFDLSTGVLMNFLQKNIDFFPKNCKGGAFKECRNSSLRDIVADEQRCFESDLKRKAACLIGLMHYKEEFEEVNFPNVLEILKDVLGEIDLLDDKSLDGKMDVITSFLALSLNEKNVRLFLPKQTTVFSSDSSDDYFINLAFKLLTIEEGKLRYGILLLGSIVKGYACEIFRNYGIIGKIVALLGRVNNIQCKLSSQLIAIIVINVIKISESLGKADEFLFEGLFLSTNQIIGNLRVDTNREEEKEISDVYLIQCLQEEEMPFPASGSDSFSFTSHHNSQSFAGATPPLSSTSSLSKPFTARSSTKADFLKVRRYIKIKYEKLLLSVLSLRSSVPDENRKIVNIILNSRLLQLFLSYRDGEECLLPRIVEQVSELLNTVHRIRFDLLYFNNFLKIKKIFENETELDKLLKDEVKDDDIVRLSKLFGTGYFTGKNEHLLAVVFFLAYGYNLEESFPQSRQILLGELQKALEMPPSSGSSGSSSSSSSVPTKRVEHILFAVFIFISYKNTGNAAVIFSNDWFIQKLFSILSCEGPSHLWPVASSLLHLLPFSDDKEQILKRLYGNPRFLPLLGDLVDIVKTPVGERRALAVSSAVFVVNSLQTILQQDFKPETLLKINFFKHTATLYTDLILATAIETKTFPSVVAEDEPTASLPFNFPCLLSSSVSPSAVGLDLSGGVHAALFEIIASTATSDPLNILQADIPKNIVGMILISMKKEGQSGLVENYALHLLEVCEHLQTVCEADKTRIPDFIKILTETQFVPQIYLLFARPEFQGKPAFGKTLMSLALSILILHSLIPADSNLIPVINYVAVSFANKDADNDEEVKRKLAALITLTSQVTNIAFLNNTLLANNLIRLFSRNDCPNSLFLLFLLIAGLVKYDSEEMKEMCKKFVDAKIFAALAPFTDFSQHANKFSFVQAIYLQLLTPEYFPQFLESDNYDEAENKSCISNFVDFLLVYFADFSNQESMQNPNSPELPPPELILALESNFSILLGLVGTEDPAVRQRLVEHNIIRSLLNVVQSGINFEVIHIYWALYMLSLFGVDGAKGDDRYNKYYQQFMEVVFAKQPTNNSTLLEGVRNVYRVLINLKKQVSEFRERGVVEPVKEFMSTSVSQNVPHYVMAIFKKFDGIFKQVGNSALRFVPPPPGEKIHLFLKTPEGERNFSQLLKELLELCLIIMFSVKKGQPLERAYLLYSNELMDDSIFIEHAGLFKRDGLLYRVSDLGADD